MSIIDIHTHAFPDDISARAIEKLESAAKWRAVGDGTVASLIESMDAAGIDTSIVCAIATKPGQEYGILKWCKQIRSPRIEPFPSVHPDTPNAAACIENIAAAGFAGIKLHPMYQDFGVDEPRMDAVYAAARDSGLVVTFHAGQDIAFAPDDDRAAPVRIRRIADKYESMKVLCTHLGGWRMWNRAVEQLAGSNVYVETSFSLGFIEPDEAADFIAAYGAERVCFGTDWPWASQSEDITRVKKLPISESDMDNILFHNATGLIGAASCDND